MRANLIERAVVGHSQLPTGIIINRDHLVGLPPWRTFQGWRFQPTSVRMSVFAKFGSFLFDLLVVLYADFVGDAGMAASLICSMTKYLSLY
jgi:hypothetical protein